MTTILVLADNHWGLASRPHEVSRIHKWILEQVSSVRPDAVLLAGDLYHGPASPELREEVSEWLQSVAETAPVLALRGNHDRPQEVAHTSRLRSRHPITAVESPEVHVIAGVAVACLPWPRGGNLLTSLSGSAKREADIAALQSILRGLGSQLDAHTGLPRVLLAHCTIAGARTGSGMRLVGLDFELGLADLPLARADAILTGHIHQRQEFALYVPCAYVGTSYATDWGDPGPHGIALLELHPRIPARLSWIDSPAEQLLTYDAGLYDPASCSWEHSDYDGEPWACPRFSEPVAIRLRYRVAAEHAGAAATLAAKQREGLLAAGANSVKIEPFIATTVRARNPEISIARGLDAKLRALWEARGTTPGEDRATRLLSKARELESTGEHQDSRL